MAEKTMSDPAHEVLRSLREGISVVVDGGAGSGKTHTMVTVLRLLLEEEPRKKIACITYTNAAAGEMNDRIQDSRVRVSTIHDFLWECIGGFQEELTQCLVECANDPSCAEIRQAVDDEGNPITIDEESFSSVTYRQYARISEGAISHDEVLFLACTMFDKYEKLRRLTVDRYPVVMVDEYQDMAPTTAKALFQLLSPDESHHLLAAFFGDPMQAIYERTVVSLDDWVKQKKVDYVQILHNRRNPSKVIQLANYLRMDNLVQKPSTDENAPNMLNGEVKEGRVFLVLGKDPHGEHQILEKEPFRSSEHGETKVLRLTHSSLAQTEGYKTLHDMYSGSDPIIDFATRLRKKVREEGGEEMLLENTFGELAATYQVTKGKGRSKIDVLNSITNDRELNPRFEKASKEPIDQLFCRYLKSDNLYAASDSRGYAPDWCPVTKIARQLAWMIGPGQQDSETLLSLIGNEIAISSHEDKVRIQRSLQTIREMTGSPIGNAIDYAYRMSIINLSDEYRIYGARHPFLFGSMRNIKLNEYLNFFQYYDEQSPFLTQHKTKGLEYSHVIVVLDNGNWNLYNFERGLSEHPSDNVAKRTRRLLYVTCTRAKETLVLYAPNEQIGAETLEQVLGRGAVLSLEEFLAQSI